ncbi:hypothetical protein C8Q80DRAFT_15431 [Daedaleopsis nitida]|nr:hypothetical protein C8Q80DRAFT_15431 [Daedaleopsis nitida]
MCSSAAPCTTALSQAAPMPAPLSAEPLSPALSRTRKRTRPQRKRKPQPAIPPHLRKGAEEHKTHYEACRDYRMRCLEFPRPPSPLGRTSITPAPDGVTAWSSTPVHPVPFPIPVSNPGSSWPWTSLAEINGALGPSVRTREVSCHRHGCVQHQRRAGDVLIVDCTQGRSGPGSQGLRDARCEAALESVLKSADRAWLRRLPPTERIARIEEFIRVYEDIFKISSKLEKVLGGDVVKWRRAAVVVPLVGEAYWARCPDSVSVSCPARR